MINLIQSQQRLKYNINGKSFHKLLSSLSSIKEVLACFKLHLRRSVKQVAMKIKIMFPDVTVIECGLKIIIKQFKWHRCFSNFLSEYIRTLLVLGSNFNRRSQYLKTFGTICTTVQMKLLRLLLGINQQTW